MAAAIQVRRRFAFFFELLLQFCYFFVKGLHQRFLDLYLLVFFLDGFVYGLLFLSFREAKFDIFALDLLLLKVNFSVKDIDLFVKSYLSLLSCMKSDLFHLFRFLGKLLLFLSLHAIELYVH